MLPINVLMKMVMLHIYSCTDEIGWYDGPAYCCIKEMYVVVVLEIVV
jgi:hypothetical protein